MTGGGWEATGVSVGSEVGAGDSGEIGFVAIGSCVVSGVADVAIGSSCWG